MRARFLNATYLRWHGVKADSPDWSPSTHALAATVRAPRLAAMVHWIVNAYWEPLDFELPPVPAEFEGTWRRWVDTGRESPEDICEWGRGRPVTDTRYHVGPRSLGFLILPEPQRRAAPTEEST